MLSPRGGVLALANIVTLIHVLSALRLLREKPQWSIAAVAEESGIGNVRTQQRRIQEVVGMTPVEYRRMLTRDL